MILVTELVEKDIRYYYNYILHVQDAKDWTCYVKTKKERKKKEREEGKRWERRKKEGKEIETKKESKEKKREGKIELIEIKTSTSKIKNTLDGLNSRSDITEEE